MKKIFENKSKFKILTIVLMALGVLFSLLGFTQPYQANSPDFDAPATIVISVLIFSNLAVTIGSLIYVIIKGRGSFFSSIYSAISAFGLIVFEKIFGSISAFAFICFLLQLLLGILLVVLNFLYDKANNPNNERISYRGKVSFVFNILSMLGLLSIFVIPFYSYIDEYGNSYNLILTQMLSGAKNLNIMVLICFIVAFALSSVSVILFMSTLSYFFSKNENYGKQSRTSVYINLFITSAFFIIGLIYTYVLSSQGYEAKTSSYIPFLIEALIAIGHASFNFVYPEAQPKKENKLSKFKFIILVVDILFIIITIITTLMNIVSIKFDYLGLSKTVEISGFILLTDKPAQASYSILLFFVLAIIITCSICLVLSLVSFFSKSKEFTYISKINIILCFLFVFSISLFGLYYDIVQQANTETIDELLADYGYNISNVLDIKVTSNSYFMLIIAAILLAIVLIFKPFTKLSSEVADLIDVNIINDNNTLNSNAKQNADIAKENKENAIPSENDQHLSNFDPCPAFSELDEKKNLFNNELDGRLQYQFKNLSLTNLTRFIVEYARDSRLHLSYTVEDIATFIAGLGATRLSILQGMSGTGKTSLPKIFCEAILGNVEIVEVESSWKDKNELLGYYNKFSKVYTPKKFTQALYKAKLNPEVVTLIVLDEMNLSRIEYYFSDFLSLMENEENKREIKLLNTKLYHTYDGIRHDYTGLSEGHTLKIPTNVWFIGTANRDESTFEISDKVYDRANTMNFNKRAPKVRSFGEPKNPLFMTYSDFNRILNLAKKSFEFDLEEYDVVKRVEELLRPYNISFGNRILLQIENFVKVYCSCFTNSKEVIPDALEKILLSKVVAKLEFKSIENKDELANKFDKLKLPLCAEFIRKINGDF